MTMQTADTILLTAWACVIVALVVWLVSAL